MKSLVLSVLLAAIFALNATAEEVISEDNFTLDLSGTAQLDYRIINTDKDDLLARRIRPVIEATAWNDLSFRFMPEFATGEIKVFDAYAEYKFDDSLKLRVGKFKPPVGLERLQSAADTMFIERGHPTNFAPSRDFGAQISGEIIPKTLEYQLGVFNGNADLANGSVDDDNNKDIVARIFAHPIKGLGVGLAGSYGERDGSIASKILPKYRTPGQQSFFSYSSATFADGTNWRLYPQAYWYNGNYGLLGEYAISSQEVTNGANHDELEHKAWQVEASYVLTGEDVNFKGGVIPEAETGAWELVGRVGQTDVDNAAFGAFANAATSASKASSYGAGINWYLNKNIKLATNYDHTVFDGAANKPDEEAIFTRAQLRF